MHKAVIIITKAENREDAIDNVKDFMEAFKEHVWDWYVIGGRWTGTLAPKYNEFMKRADVLLKEHPINKEMGCVLQSSVDENQNTLQQMWNDLGMEGQNPYCNHYNLPCSGGKYDVMYLKDCIDAVKKWQQDYIKDGKKREEEAQEWINGKRGKDNYNMYGYCLECAAKIYRQEFSFECDVYNMETDNFQLPDDYTGYWAVIVDMHN